MDKPTQKQMAVDDGYAMSFDTMNAMGDGHMTSHTMTSSISEQQENILINA